VKSGLLGKVRQLLAGAADDILERNTSPPRENAQLAHARTIIRDELGLLFVSQRQLTKDIAAARADLSGLLDKANFAVAANREDLARAALAYQQSLEQRITDMTEAQEAVRAQIALLENAAAILQPASPVNTAAKLAELDRLLAETER
jgi:phage shock protein A